MSLAPGTRLGAYEITAPIGAGGMGEVYRARDTRLNRDVAIKVLPEAFATDPERLARFKREAHVLASLNHPHIATIYGLEETENASALILELVEGPTLADRIAQGLIPLDEALPIAKQICEALEAAHERGIIHRDLKPANIKLTPDGTVKVLDFGLAKPTSGPANTTTSLSPTITSPAMTMAGVLLGSAAYMSPEQAKGREADKRSDVWGFGCVLYEMLTGERAFEGEDTSDTLAAVLRAEPDWKKLPAYTPPRLHRLLQRCLRRDPKNRLHDIGDARLEILGDDGPADATTPQEFQNSRIRSVVLVSVSLVVGAAVTAFSAFIWSRPATVKPATIRRFTLTDESHSPILVDWPIRNFAMSPDGSKIVFTDANNRLFIRHFDRLDPTPLRDSGAQPFFSPDGRSVGLLGNNRTLKKITLVDGSVVTMATSIPNQLR
jgi:serine/threonine protein kinase